jgi:hypothetical protein
VRTCDGEEASAVAGAAARREEASEKKKALDMHMGGKTAYKTRFLSIRGVGKLTGASDSVPFCWPLSQKY